MSNKVSVHDGIANVEPSIFSHRLLGATCATSLRVEDAAVSHSFRILPDKRHAQDLVLVERYYDSRPKLVLFHIKHVDGKGTCMKIQLTSVRW